MFWVMFIARSVERCVLLKNASRRRVCMLSILCLLDPLEDAKWRRVLVTCLHVTQTCLPDVQEAPLEDTWHEDECSEVTRSLFIFPTVVGACMAGILWGQFYGDPNFELKSAILTSKWWFGRKLTKIEPKLTMLDLHDYMDPDKVPTC